MAADGHRHRPAAARTTWYQPLKGIVAPIVSPPSHRVSDVACAVATATAAAAAAALLPCRCLALHHQMAGGNLENAVNLFMEMGPAAVTATSSTGVGVGGGGGAGVPASTRCACCRAPRAPPH